MIRDQTAFSSPTAPAISTHSLSRHPATVTTSGRLENNTTNVFGPPVVDSSAEEVYTFIGYSGDPGNTGHPSYINIFPAAALGSAGPGVPSVSNYGTGVHFANGGTNNPTTSNMRLGAFDNLYYEGTGTTGNIYVCENGVVYQIPLATVATSGGEHLQHPCHDTRHGVGMRSCYGIPGHEGSNDAFCGH